MNTLVRVALIIIGLVCLWFLSIIIGYTPIRWFESKKEKFVVKNRLTRVPQMINSETHDVLAYSLGYS